MNKKVSIILSGILALIIVLVWFVFKDKNNETVENNYIILGNNTYWLNNGEKWSHEYATNWDEANKLIVYVDDIYQGVYNAEYINSWNFMDDENNYLNYEERILATSSNFINNVKKIKSADILQEDIDYINKLTSNNYTLEDVSRIFLEKYLVDLNDDGIDEYIISVNNLLEEEKDTYFNLIYANIDNNINIILNENIKAKDAHLKPTYNLYSVIKINDIKIPNIIFKETFYSTTNRPKFIMYEIIGQKYQVVIED